MRPKRTTRDILAFNAGRDTQRLQLKFQHLRQDPFAFFRGTNHLFLRRLPRSHAVFRAPAIWTCGDLHLENFGTYKGDNRLCYFDINDFDESCLAPFTLDIVRFIASVHAAAPMLKLSRGERAILIRSFLSGYRDAVLSGEPRWVERSIAEGAIRDLLRRAMRRTRVQILDRYTRLGRKRRRLLRDDVRLFEVPESQVKSLRRLCKSLHTLGLAPSFFTLRDAAHRAAGNASLGSPRFALLVRGRGSPDGNFILDLKRGDPSSAAGWSRLRQRAWSNDADRIASVQGLMQAIAPALLHAVRYAGTGYVLKELQPTLDRLDLARLRERPRRMRRVLESMGRITAWAHLRGCGRWGAGPVEELQRHVQGRRWSAAAEQLAAHVAKQLHQDWREFCADYDSGRVVY
jgi:uncharacterized protein (DUF2252 family)